MTKIPHVARHAVLPFWACVAAAAVYYPQAVGAGYLFAFLVALGAMAILLLRRWM